MSGQTGEFTHGGGARLIVHRNASNPLTTAPPPPQPVEITDNRPKRWTVAQIRAMSAADFQKNLSNPEFIAAVDALYSQ
jgi:hypothetical protein